jgi:hypothetical protein
VVSAIAADLDVPAAVKVDRTRTAQQSLEGKDDSTWAVVARSSGDRLPVDGSEGWQRVLPESRSQGSAFLWTDDRSNLIDLFVSRRPR